MTTTPNERTPTCPNLRFEWDVKSALSILRSGRASIAEARLVSALQRRSEARAAGIEKAKGADKAAPHAPTLDPDHD